MLKDQCLKKPKFERTSQRTQWWKWIDPKVTVYLLYNMSDILILRALYLS